jgi:hypothetical protein
VAEMVIQGQIQFSVYQSFSYTFDVLCQPVLIYLMHINSILLTDCVMVMVTIIQKPC